MRPGCLPLFYPLLSFRRIELLPLWICSSEQEKNCSCFAIFLLFRAFLRSQYPYILFIVSFSRPTPSGNKEWKRKGKRCSTRLLLASSGRERKMKNRAPIQPRVLFFSRFHTMVGRQVWSSPDRQGVKKIKTMHACISAAVQVPSAG